MADRIETDELARAIAATARAHHAAFAKSDGYDPDWAIWYAGHLQATIWDRLGALASRAELTYLLVAAERAYGEADPTTRGDWQAFYARHVLANVRGA